MRGINNEVLKTWLYCNEHDNFGFHALVTLHSQYNFRSSWFFD